MNKMAPWIEVTPRLQKGVNIAKQVDTSKFRLLLNRICQSLLSDITAKAFSEEEEEKLLVSLNLNKDDLCSLVDASTSIYKQAACNIVKPSVMESFLKETFKLEDEMLSVFINAWMSYGKGIINNFRQKSVFPTQVNDINWILNIETASSKTSRNARPLALLQLDFTGEKTSKLTVEFDENDLIEMHKNLEKIQKQLDALK